MARPTKYTPELLEKAHSYIANWRTLGNAIPSHDALAGYLGITRTTLYDWAGAKDKAEFSDILDEVSRLQKMELVDNGLLGDFNSTMAKLMLTKHGLSDKVETENKHSIDLSGKSEAELEAIIASAGE